MKKIKLRLREKITLIFVATVTIMCITLTTSVFYSADKLVETTPVIPAIVLEEVIQKQEIIVEPSVCIAANIEQANRSFRMEILFMMIAILFAGAGTIFFLTGKALKPLETLTDIVERQTIDDLANDLPLPHSNDEILKLTQAFNTRNKQICESYSIQKNFSANAAHELYTPLAVMQTKLDVFALSSNRSLEEYESLIGFIEDNTQRLTAIIENLMKITNSHDIDLNQKIFLNDLIEEVLFEFEDILDKQNIFAQVTGKNVMITGNNTLLTQAFYNLINNAIKYNVTGGSIITTIKEDADEVRVSIRDEGIGVPDECKNRLFEPFFRVNESRSQDIGGSGLGLALVKKIIEIHNGQIVITDNIPKGTIFEISFHK